MDRKERLYFNKSTNFDELLEMIESSEIQFYYKKRAYNITWDKGPCIVAIDEGWDIYDSSMRHYSTFEELLLKHVFDDGATILDALASEFIELY